MRKGGDRTRHVRMRTTRGKPLSGKKKSPRTRQGPRRGKMVGLQPPGARRRAPAIRIVARPMPIGRRGNVSPLVRVCAAIAFAVLPGCVSRPVGVAGPPRIPPNPAVWASVAKTKISTKTQKSLEKKQQGFNMFRVTQRTTKGGPVVILERFTPFKGKPNNLQLGLAQEVRIKGDVLARLGVRMPDLGEGRIDWKKSDFGIMLSKEGVGLGAHRLGGKDAARFSVTVPAKEAAVDASYMQPGYFSTGQATRIGVSNLEKALGIDLGKLSTNFGMTFPKGERGTVDARVFYKTDFGKLVLEYFETGTGGSTLAGVIVINF